MYCIYNVINYIPIIYILTYSVQLYHTAVSAVTRAIKSSYMVITKSKGSVILNEGV